jgi:hypothetical protein
VLWELPNATGGQLPAMADDIERAILICFNSGDGQHLKVS